MKVKSNDIIIRYVEGYGWLPIVEKYGKEVFRGEFQKSPQYALWKAFEVENGEEAT